MDNATVIQILVFIAVALFVIALVRTLRRWYRTFRVGTELYREMRSDPDLRQKLATGDPAALRGIARRMHDVGADSPGEIDLDLNS